MGIVNETVALALKRALYGRRGEPYRIGGHTLRFTPGSRPTRLRYASSPNAVNRYDALQQIILTERLREGDFAIDIGGHTGEVALLMAACCGSSGRVVTFEPDPDARAGLERNLDLNPSLKRPKIESAAVFDVGGQTSFFSDRGNCNSSLRRWDGAIDLKELIVPTVQLDQYLAKEPRRPDWVKIDVEGAEIRVLRGARKLLDGPTEILCELHPYAWPVFGDSFEDLMDLVASSGRWIRYIDQNRPVEDEVVYGTVMLEHSAS